MYTISPCNTTNERRLFEKLPEILHKTDRHYVPPFPDSIVKILGSGSAFSRTHGQIHPFVAWKEGRACGRIAAIINNSHNAHHRDKTGFFGYFDSENDQELASALLNHAESVLHREGRDTMRGPYHPSIHDECGLLSAGFDTAPYIFMQHNPSYYEGLLSGAGFVKWHELYAFVIDHAQGVPERIERVISRRLRSLKVRIRDIDMKNLRRDLRIMCDLYNRTLDHNKGFYPITMADLNEAAEGLKEFADPRLILFAECEGNPVAFAMMLPNLNDFLLRAKKRRGIFRFLELVWKIKTGRPQNARLAVLGVLPGFRDRGLGAALYSECQKRGKTIGYQSTEVSWIDKDNRDIIRAINAMGCRQTKTYSLYEKNITTE